MKLKNLALLMLFTIFSWGELRAQNIEDIFVCHDHLVLVGKGIRNYWNKIKDYPEDFREIILEGFLDEKSLVCPATPSFLGVHPSSYTYKKNVLKKIQELNLLQSIPALSPYVIVACDKKNIHEVSKVASGKDWYPMGRNLLFLNGDVLYLGKNYVERLLEVENTWMEALYSQQDSTHATQQFIQTSKNLIEAGLKEIAEGQQTKKDKIESVKFKFLLICLFSGVIVFIVVFLRSKNKNYYHSQKSAENATICIVFLLIFGGILFYLSIMGEQLTPEEFFMVNILAFPALGFSSAVLTQPGVGSKFFGIVTSICYLSLIVFILLNSFFASLLEI